LEDVEEFGRNEITIKTLNFLQKANRKARGS
jgi:hypothetical protein